MSKLFLTLTTALALTALAGQALALNPQPLPPLQMPGQHGGPHAVAHAPVVRF
jgi:hypothetical protein